MPDSSQPLASDGKPRGAETYSWQDLLQHSPEPLFLLNRHRRVLGVNPAWEKLLGISAADARELVCSPRRQASEAGALGSVVSALCPPAEVLEGKIGRVRRCVFGRASPQQWWDVDFFPLRDANGRLRILGRILPLPVDDTVSCAPPPGRLNGLRERLDQRYGWEQLASSVPRMQRVADQVRLASGSRVPVLIVGEPGAGKEWVARTIHHQGESRALHFAAIECGGLPVPALEGVLFGDGGLLEDPAMGTVYLKDVPALPRDLQDRLALWLGEPGLGRPRLIAGGARELGDVVAAERMHEGLHCALGTLTIAIPPLRERLADLPRLVDHFLRRMSAAGTSPVKGLTPAAWGVFDAYPWPGNLHELSTVLAGSRRRAKSAWIDTPDLPAYVRLTSKMEGKMAPDHRPVVLDQVLEEVERRLMGLALRKARGNKSKAAELVSVWRARFVRRAQALGVGAGEQPAK